MTNPKLRHDTGEKENAGKTSLDQEWIFPQSTHVNPGVECYKHNSSGNFDNWQPTPKNMINEYPTDNDYCSISETIACPQSFLESENSCYSPTLSQVINAIEHEEYHADGTQAQIGCRDDLDTQVLHRAFDAIVLSEEGPMCKVRDYGMEASFGTTSNEKPFLSQYISQIRAPWTGASAPYAFGTAGGMAGKHLMCGMTDHLLGSHATQDYGTCPEFIGLPRDFWRQNRLY
ncbi:uncharacterized protein ACLA_036540 [Aspergillus clavatus NRRL 1]|uniref:Uncharacterized protein n=1 Tax=Aspergillus clavatus (strain ATCC 1007 / CBS 513.65 / DSM 816 / NCTC 3887 / NRRL 1 / QM 1276 / 107) TaxID=344612 RepID=A1CJX6_ASPCL|nr:uncharacterized protein ACLA_036540 [Aspergillus clavatus NRRL 1]EAW09450.1 hypothetical protein ACLA_036540 [Aspergillus clavatus NRRL 1]